MSVVALVVAWQFSLAPLDAERSAQDAQRITDGMTAERIAELMREFNRALGVECGHCHVGERWRDDSKPAYAVSRNMYRMVREINERLLADVGVVACWTCHRGRATPSRLPRARLDAQLARWPAELASAQPSTKLTMSVYAATLGVGCEHCHVEGDWKGGQKRPMALVRRMLSLFEEFPKYMPEKARTQCWTCHKGTTQPAVN
jgi:cytochrome c